MGIALDEEDKGKLKFLNDAFLGLRSKVKGTYASWNCYFETIKGNNYVIM